MMAGSTRTPSVILDKLLKRTGLTGVILGVFALLACELTPILAAVGLGGLSAVAAWFRPPPAVEIAAVGLSVLGAAALIIMPALRMMRKRRPEEL